MRPALQAKNYTTEPEVLRLQMQTDLLCGASRNFLSLDLDRSAYSPFRRCLLLDSVGLFLLSPYSAR